MPDKQQRKPTPRPERSLDKAVPDATRMAGAAQDGDILEAVGGSRPQTNPGPGQTGPINKSHELAGDTRQLETLTEGQREAAPPTRQRKPSSGDSEQSGS